MESTGYDERAWLDGKRLPSQSRICIIVERYSHPDAVTLQISMTLTDPKVYTKPWVGPEDLQDGIAEGPYGTQRELLRAFGGRKL